MGVWGCGGVCVCVGVRDSISYNVATVVMVTYSGETLSSPLGSYIRK